MRVLPATAPASRVVASVGARSAQLVADPRPREWRGTLAVPPGLQMVHLEAFDAAGTSLASADVPVATARGAPAAVDATIGSGSDSPVVRSLVVPRTSVVAGDHLLLSARVDPHPRAALSWTAVPSGCGSFTAAGTGATRWTSSDAGPCTLTVAATALGRSDRRSATVVVRSSGRSFEYPVRVAPGGRHLADHRGRAFLLKGETAWLALVNLTREEQEHYLADRAAKGFNAVEVMLVNHDYTSAPNPTPPANRAGERPFREPGDFSTPDDAYFARAAKFVDLAAGHGIVVLIAPLYLGFDGGREGWWKELNAPANTRQRCARFGRYLGALFKGKKNVLWLAGGDFAPPPGSEGEARYWEIVNGIRAAGASQPWTGHWNFDHLGGISTDQRRFRDTMALNGVYQYANPYRFAARAYGLSPPLPVFLLESAYEHEHPAGDLQPFRKAWWWTMLSGGSGVFWSNAFLWLCESARRTYRIDYGDVDRATSSWAAELDSAGTYEALHLHALFEALPWHRLVPIGIGGGGREWVVSGQRRGEKHIAAAATPEGDLLVAYVPPGSGSRTFGIDLSAMRGAISARWYDPSTGGWTPLGRTLESNARVGLETPGKNGAGSDDWVLVVEAGAGSSAPR